MKLFIEIEGAVVFQDMKHEGDTIVFPKPNKEYKAAMITDEVVLDRAGFVLLASKDLKSFVIAVSVVIDGEKRTLKSIAEELIGEEETTL